ncbi:aminotransferase-like domain-containing protein [Mucilaginibacter arboris]|uniref:Aminotransferase class I/II-fold pyridoxal phosphate-dependent enzyme n=1 Tax=Mucilaginibacter arboris TaxID=2682090 RepID=A0A7K1T1B4_9SPHI|nr:PLP-dependent aminotransferase family protein [Mucilaginibacter arboris]MVN23318.1 aminotransferase class I/II-fold pyridoxal phosphate-dependent enzyme [Mucilaginibacter arboris]
MINKNIDFLYLQISDKIGRQIRQQTLKTGKKLPSVRALSQEQGISLSTAFKAYSQLEMEGLIEARPKSGYYVRYSPAKSFTQDPKKTQTTNTEVVTAEDMIARVYHNIAEEGVLKLSIAAPGLSLLPQAKLNKSMVEAIRQSSSSCIHYEDVQGNHNLRKHLASQAFSWGGSISPDDIVTTNGCMEALAFCLRAVTKPGDLIAIESPTYFGIFGLIQSLNLNIVEIPGGPLEGLDLGHLKKVIQAQPIKACLFVPTFSNPLGYCLSNEKKQELVNLLANHDIPLIEDDIYGEMYFGKTRPRTCKSYDKKGLVMLCSSISKSLAPGYRVGWCIPGKFIKQIIQLKFSNSLSSVTITQAAIGHFFETGRYDLHMRKLRKELHTQCLRYIQSIVEYFPPDIKISQPCGGYVLWIELPKSVDAFELFQQAIKQQISIAPGQIFSINGNYTHFIRISFGLPYNSDINKSLKALGGLIYKLTK